MRTYLIILLMTATVTAAPVATGRYTAVAPLPTPAQAEPLAEIVTLSLPASTSTVGEGIDLVLAGTGYALFDVLHWEADFADLLDAPLPRAHRELGPLPVWRALQVLVGPGYVVAADPIRREVGFRARFSRAGK